MVKKERAALGLLAGFALAGLTLAGVSAQPAPPDDEIVFTDADMNPSLLAERIGNIPRPSKTGDDKVACDRATRARARREAGLITAEEHGKAMHEAKAAAATDAMRRAIDSGMIPSCPPDGDPTGGMRP